jgi:hypothetical protein
MAIDLAPIAAVVERYMQNTVVISRKTGTVQDPVTLQEVDTYKTIYSGKGMASPMGDPAATQRASEDVYRIQYEVGIPRDAPLVPPVRTRPSLPGNHYGYTTSFPLHS